MTVPVVTVYRVDADDAIDSYRVFLDLGLVFADARVILVLEGRAPRDLVARLAVDEPASRGASL